MAQLLAPTHIALIRAQSPDAWAAPKHPDLLSRCGVIRTRSPKRAATCRCCGQRIPAGAPALQFAWDFTEAGPGRSILWTTCYLHQEVCR